MKAFQEIPSSYHECARIELQKDRRTMMMINAFGIIIMVAMTVGMAIFRPIHALFDMSQGLGAYTLRFVGLILGYVLYIVLHELTHACVMRLLGLVLPECTLTREVTLTILIGPDMSALHWLRLSFGLSFSSLQAPLCLRTGSGCFTFCRSGMSQAQQETCM